jgi:ABC-type antimicrobial peptide transport system permease subunit
MTLLLWFGLCAALLAAGGVYSVIAETTTSRRREMAIKSALGARKPRLVREIVANSLVVVIIGEAGGIACTAVFAPLVSDLLYAVSPHDPIVLGPVSAFLFLVSALAAFWPAWFAAGTDPLMSLKSY